LVEGFRTAMLVAGQIVEALDAADLASAEIRRAVSRRDESAPGALRAVVDPSALTAASLLRRPPGETLTLTDAGDEVVLASAARRLRLPAYTRPALEAALNSEVLSVGDLDGLDHDSQPVLARRLLREGFLELVQPRRRASSQP
jgi:hypothetical protein